MPAPLDQVTLAILAGGQGSRMGKPKALLEINGRPILAYLLDQFRWPGLTLLVTAPGREKPPGHELFSREVTDPVGGEGPLRGILTALEASDMPFTVIATVDMPEIRAEHLAWVIATLTSGSGAYPLPRYSGGGPGWGPSSDPYSPAFTPVSAFGRGRTGVNAGLCGDPHPNPPPEYQGREKNHPAQASNSPSGVMCRRPDGTIEPFPCAFQSRASEMIRDRLTAGERSVHSLAETGVAVAIPCPADWPASIWTNLNRPEELRAWNAARARNTGVPPVLEL